MIKKKEHLIDILNSSYINERLKPILISMSVNIDYPYCLNLSNQFGGPIQTYKKEISKFN